MNTELPAHEPRLVYDGLLRLIHWWNALAIGLLIATALGFEFLEHGSLERSLAEIHAYLGYALIGGLAARLVWGFVGPRSARWSDLWHPGIWIEVLRTFRLPAERRGHDALASLAFLGVYTLLLVMAVTGLGLAAVELDMGPLTRWLGAGGRLDDALGAIHESVFNLIWMFVVLHLGALAVHLWLGHTHVAQSMVGSAKGGRNA